MSREEVRLGAGTVIEGGLFLMRESATNQKERVLRTQILNIDCAFYKLQFLRCSVHRVLHAVSVIKATRRTTYLTL